jgi:hypothetical protein
MLSMPPAMSTRPSLSLVAVWLSRTIDIAFAAANVPDAGS